MKLDRLLLATYSGLVLAFLIIPLLVVIPISFNPGTVLQFPPKGISLRWYHDFLQDERWLRALWLSLRLAFSVSILATTIGLLTALALTRFVKRGKALFRALLLTPLIFPAIVVGIAMFDVFNTVGLVRTFAGLVVAHTILAIPYAVLTIESGLKRVSTDLEDAAVSLGASRLQAFRRITLPMIVPSLVAAAVFSFVISWDEVVLVVFISGARQQTLPLRMFEFLQTEIRPTLAAISALLIVALFCALTASQLVQFLRGKKKQRPVDRELPAANDARNTSSG